jgi:hypothetical protein
MPSSQGLREMSPRLSPALCDPVLLIPFAVPTEPPDPALEEPVRVFIDSFSVAPASLPFSFFPFTLSRIDPNSGSAGLGLPALPLALETPAFPNLNDSERESDSTTGEK